ncbi:MAG TPA: formylglycine-generating enzyme family protein [Caulobacteraceae bacterium]|nr:formylglycine-generating enzyme family protein [Caulobacteraceae bacterium]
MGQARGKSALLAALVLSALVGAGARADDPTVWLKDRQARFAAYRAAHPHPDAEIAAIKAKTAAWKATEKPLELWDGAELPEMIVVPAGEFAMGSPDAEPNHQNSEAPRHRVRIGYPFAVGKYLVTVGEFARFAAETHYEAGDQCLTMEGGGLDSRTGRDWRHVGFDQTDNHPVICMSYGDAEAYVAWLSKKTGHAYRLLSEAESEYVNRAGSDAAYWWGDDPAAACTYANGADLDAKAQLPQLSANPACHDGYVFTSPVGSFKPNPFGLYDTTGDAWSWTDDCANDSYAGAPSDGSANLAGDCGQHVLRGGSKLNDATFLRAARRIWHLNGVRSFNHGFRVARSL